ncbi:MAG: hypothetical protein WEC59_07255 [Salibacteraceae bacterium]
MITSEPLEDLDSILVFDARSHNEPVKAHIYIHSESGATELFNDDCLITYNQADKTTLIDIVLTDTDPQSLDDTMVEGLIDIPLSKISTDADGNIANDAVLHWKVSVQNSSRLSRLKSKSLKRAKKNIIG